MCIQLDSLFLIDFALSGDELIIIFPLVLGTSVKPITMLTPSAISKIFVIVLALGILSGISQDGGAMRR